MKKLKTYENFNSNLSMKENILSYIQKEYPKSWWDLELVQRIHDYLDNNEIERFNDEKEAYKYYGTGGAVEYDILKEISNDVMNHFNINEEEFYNNDYNDIINDYMIDTIDWYDSYIFQKSDKEYKNELEKVLGIKPLKNKWDLEDLDL